MYLVGIDPAIRRIAAAVMHATTGQLVGTRFELLPRTEDTREWHAQVRDFLVGLDRMTDGSVVACFVEPCAFVGPNAKTAIRHAAAAGATTALSWRVWPHALIETEAAEPRRWRQACGIERSGKDAVRAWAEAQWPQLAGREQDEIDAACIAWAGYLATTEGTGD